MKHNWYWFKGNESNGNRINVFETEKKSKQKPWGKKTLQRKSGWNETLITVARIKKKEI